MTDKAMSHNSIDLYTLYTSLKDGMEKLFPGKIWIRAEISAVKVRQGGHCYMELSQSGDNGLIAKANAIIWASKYRFLGPFFKSVTGSDLREGINVLVRVQVNFSQLYGLSLIIDDIDAEFTLGEQEMKRRMTIERLDKEGLMQLQKGLVLPLIPYRLAVISAFDAAGYRDFVRHLEENEYGFAFNIELFQALMQGQDSPSSIIDAMSLSFEWEPDAILILRGGGAKIDLSCYDDYELSAAIARSPVPVFTAVGHDQDYHVCDMVAYKYLKTPTALADEFLSYPIAEDERILSLASRLRRSFEQRLMNEESKVYDFGKYIVNQVKAKIMAAESKLDFMEMRISATDPRNILSKGFSMVLDAKGVKIGSIKGRSKGDDISVLFSDGRLECKIKEVKKH